jgi:HEPN domain-containing protein
VAKYNLKGTFYSDACYMAEQTAQIALKAFIIARKRRQIWEHSVQELARLCIRYDKDFSPLVDAGKILDRYYIPTRYPDALASPAVPYKTFIERDAVEGVRLAEKILSLVKQRL